MKHVIDTLMIWLVVTAAVSGQEATKGPSENNVAETPHSDQADIESAIESYVAAFNAGDVSNLVSLWCEEGVYVSRNSGENVVGHQELTEEFTAIFASEGSPKLTCTTESIDLISPNVALERGTATVTRSEDDVVESKYKVVYVKRNGKWLIDRVTDDEIIVRQSNYQQLKELEWLVGDWVDSGDGITIDVSCQWTKNQNFLARKYSVSVDQEIESTGLQIIGWNAKEKQINSWLFDSDGGVITGTWTQSDGRWIVQSVGTMADGATGSYTSIFRPLEDGNFTWQKVNRVLDGKLLPSIDEIVVQRK